MELDVQMNTVSMFKDLTVYDFWAGFSPSGVEFRRILGANVKRTFNLDELEGVGSLQRGGICRGMI
jgi:hypothetical protein